MGPNARLGAFMNMNYLEQVWLDKYELVRNSTYDRDKKIELDTSSM